MNLAQLLEGPCNVLHYGQTFHFAGGLKLTPMADLFSVESDVHGTIGQRGKDNSFVLSGKPIGRWTAGQLGALFRTSLLPIGSLLNPRYDVASVAGNIFTLVGAAVPRTGCPVRLSAFPGGVLPTGTAALTTYFWGADGALHDTEAHAIAGTNPIVLTSAGTPDFAMIEQEYIQINALTANRQITFWNGCVTKPPGVSLSSTVTPLDEVSFGAFISDGQANTDANSAYTVAKAALADVPPAASDIITQPYSLAFGAAPWNAFTTRGPIKLTAALGVDAVMDDPIGTVGLKVKSRGCSARFTPSGFSHQQMLDLLQVQGVATAARGSDKTRGNLVITGTGVVCTLYNGAPRTLPQTFSDNGPLAGELEVVGAATPGSAPFLFTT